MGCPQHTSSPPPTFVTTTSFQHMVHTNFSPTFFTAVMPPPLEIGHIAQGERLKKENHLIGDVLRPHQTLSGDMDVDSPYTSWRNYVLDSVSSPANFVNLQWRRCTDSFSKGPDSRVDDPSLEIRVFTVVDDDIRAVFPLVKLPPFHKHFHTEFPAIGHLE